MGNRSFVECSAIGDLLESDLDIVDFIFVPCSVFVPFISL
jgi:hypothetical protein